MIIISECQKLILRNDRGDKKSCIKALLNWITSSIIAKKGVRVWGIVKSPILMIRVAGIIIARISKYFHKSWTKNNIILKLFGFCRVISPRLVPRQLGDETAVWCMCGDQVPVNLQTARKCTGITRIYILHINPDPPPAANGAVNNFKVQHQKSFNCIFLTAVQMCNKQ